MVGYDGCSVAEFSLAEEWQRLDSIASIVALAKTFFTVPNNWSSVKGFRSVAKGWSHAFASNFSVIKSPDARMTGNVMCAERTFLTSSIPETLGVLLSVIRRS